MRLRPLFAAALILCGLSTPALAQYMYLDANGDGAHSSADTLNVPGLTTIDVWLRTDANRDGTPRTCPGGSFDLFSYEFTLRANGGTLAWGAYSNNLTALPSNLGHYSDSIEFHTSYSGTTTLAAGSYRLGTLTVLVARGRPSVSIIAETDHGPYLTAFGTRCTATVHPNTSALGQDWTDVDGLAASSQSVLLLEDFESSGGALPNYWTTYDDNPGTFSVPWGVTNSFCGYVEGNYSATCAAFYCNAYQNDQTAVLERTLEMSAYTRYHVAFRERHELAANDVFSYINSIYDVFTGTWIDSPPQNLTGSVGEWTPRSAGNLENAGHSADVFKMKFVFTSDATVTNKGFYLDNIQIFGTTRPDLVPTAVTVVPPLVGGQAWQLKYTISNLGGTDAVLFTVQPYLDDQPFGAAISEFALAAGASRTSPNYTMGVVSAGEHRIRIMVDAGGSNDEGISGEANNNTPNQSHIWGPPPAPDLVVDSLTVSNPSPTPGDSIDVRIVVRNQGTAPAGVFQVGWYRNRASPPSVGTTPDISRSTTSPLASEARATFSFKASSGTTTSWQMYALADWMPAPISELDESNNTRGPVQVSWAPGLVTIRGSFTYDDSLIGANQFMPCLPVYLYHRDIVSGDSLVGTGTTQDGLNYFEIGPIQNFDPTPPPGGNTKLDLYLRIDFRTHAQCWGNPRDSIPYWAVSVYDAFDSLWHYDSPVVQDVPNGIYDFGILRPTDYAHEAALHIYRIITYKGWGYFDLNGISVPAIKIRWQPGFAAGGGTAYLPGEHTIEVSGYLSKVNLWPDEWDDLVLLHEYGHHFAHVFQRATTDSDSICTSCRPYFDQGSLGQAFLEGWADYIGAERNRDALDAAHPLRINTGLDPDGTRQTEQWNLETGQYVMLGNNGQVIPPIVGSRNEAGPKSQIAVGAALWDLADPEDDNPNGDAFADNHFGGTGTLFRVMSEWADTLLSICQFENAYVSMWCCDPRYPNYVLTAQGVFREHGIFCGLYGPTAVEADETPLAEFALSQNYPNPFNPHTRIRLTLPRLETPSKATLRIYDVGGRLVRELLNEPRGDGSYEVVWDGKSRLGSQVSSGVYYCRLSYGGQERSIRITLLR